PLVEIEQPAEPRTPAHATRHVDRRRARNETIAESLVISFGMIGLHELPYGPPQVPLPDWNPPFQTFFFDRPAKPFPVSVRIWRAVGDEDDLGARVTQSTPDVTAPLPIAV